MVGKMAVALHIVMLPGTYRVHKAVGGLVGSNEGGNITSSYRYWQCDSKIELLEWLAESSHAKHRIQLDYNTASVVSKRIISKLHQSDEWEDLSIDEEGLVG